MEGDFLADDILMLDAVAMDSAQALVPFRFLYGWWRGLATLVGRVVGVGCGLWGCCEGWRGGSGQGCQHGVIRATFAIESYHL